MKTNISTVDAVIALFDYDIDEFIVEVSAEELEEILIKFKVYNLIPKNIFEFPSKFEKEFILGHKNKVRFSIGNVCGSLCIKVTECALYMQYDLGRLKKFGKVFGAHEVKIEGEFSYSGRRAFFWWD